MISPCKFLRPNSAITSPTTPAVAPPRRRRRFAVRNLVSPELFAPTAMDITVDRKPPELILPSRPTPAESLPLSALDARLRLQMKAPLIFFYRRNPKMDGRDPAKVIREALAEALAYYYPFAGRLIEGSDSKLAVDCTDSGLGGVFFVEADADIELDEFGDNVFPPSPYSHLFLCSEEENRENEYEKNTISGPMLLIQVTRFKCNGFAVGVVFNHTIADGYGLSLMLSAVAEFARGARAPSTLPVWERHLFTARSPPQASHVEKYYEDPATDAAARDKIKQTELNLTTPAAIFLTGENLQAMRDRHGLHSFTKFELITAAIWKARTLLLKPDPDEITRVTCVADARSARAMRRVPKGYYGNVVFTPSAACTAAEMAGKRTDEVAAMVRGAKALLRDPEYFRSTVDHIATRPSLSHIRLNLTVSDFCRLGFGRLDFGWGEPYYAGSPIVKHWVTFYQTVRSFSGGEDETMVCLRVPKGFEVDFLRMMMGE